jgi:hypothetical protein
VGGHRAVRALDQPCRLFESENPWRRTAVTATCSRSAPVSGGPCVGRQGKSATLLTPFRAACPARAAELRLPFHAISAMTAGACPEKPMRVAEADDRHSESASRDHGV